MLKSELLNFLTVEQWMKFKHFAMQRPQKYVKLSDGRELVDYEERDLHEFWGIENAPGKDN